MFYDHITLMSHAQTGNQWNNTKYEYVTHFISCRRSLALYIEIRDVGELGTIMIGVREGFFIC